MKRLMSIGLMKLYPMQALMDAGMSETAASGVAGTAMAVFFSLANGLYHGGGEVFLHQSAANICPILLIQALAFVGGFIGGFVQYDAKAGGLAF